MPIYSTGFIPSEPFDIIGEKLIIIKNEIVKEWNDLEIYSKKLGLAENFDPFSRIIPAYLYKYGIKKLWCIGFGDYKDILSSLVSVIDFSSLILFNYPDERDQVKLIKSFDVFTDQLGVDIKSVEDYFRLTSCKNEDILYKKDLKGIPVGIIGTYSFLLLDLTDYLELKGFSVIYDEYRYEHSFTEIYESIWDKYLSYTFPYGLEVRALKIKQIIEKFNIKALIIVTSSFPPSIFEATYFRKIFSLPMICLEVNTQRAIDETEKIRLDSFMTKIVMDLG